MSIIRRVPWTVQPQAAVVAREYAPYFVWLGSRFARDDENAGIAVTELNKVVGAQGIGATLKTSSSAVARASGTLPGPGSAFTFFIVYEPISGTGALGGTKATWNAGGGFYVEANGLNSVYITGSNGTGWQPTVTGAAEAGKRNVLFVEYKGTAVRAAFNGVYVGASTVGVAPATWAFPIGLGNICYAGVSGGWTTVKIYAGGVLARTGLDIVGLSANPWQLFAPLPRRIWVPVSAGGVATHDASGALVGPGAVIAGSAAHIAKHATTGALVGPGSTVAGASARTRAHPTSGALTGPGSVVSGAADHTTPGGTHDTTGALVGPGAVIAGSAAHIAKHTTSGALVGPGSVISGAAAGPATAAVNRAGGFRRREGPRKGYIIKGRRYWLTDEELSIEIALMLAEVSRSDIKEVTAGKPKTISKRTWDAIRPLERMEALVPNYDDDEEALLMLM